MVNELINEMVDAGVHYGHQTRKWNPKMKPFLMKDKGGIYIINLEETVKCLDKASDFLGELASKGQKILFVGCKRQAQDSVAEAAEAIGQYYVNHRWLGGTLTNLATIRRSVERLKYLEDIEKSPDSKKMSKKELSALGRERTKLLRNLRGIRDMEKLPAAMVIVDSARETIAVAEARRLNIPVVAIVDTNCSPDGVDYVIPGNDDAARAIALACGVAIDMTTATGDAAWQSRAAFLTPIAKAFGTDVGIEVSTTGMQVHGGMGFIEETGAAQYLRDVRVTAIYEGTNGIQALDLVGRKLMDGGEAAFRLLDEIEAGAEAARATHKDLAMAVWQSAESLREATEGLLARDMADRGGVAVPYLRAFARVLGGHYHLAAAQAGDAARQKLAAFYIERLLPEHVALLAHVRHGSDGLMSITPDDLAL